MRIVELSVKGWRIQSMVVLASDGSPCSDVHAGAEVLAAHSSPLFGEPGDYVSAAVRARGSSG